MSVGLAGPKQVSNAATVLVLASASRSRAALLRNAGVPVEIVPSDIDEAVIKAQSLDDTTEALSMRLAEAKARQVAERCGDRLVLGADQILEIDGTRFDKPENRAEARRQLEMLSGRTHRLVSSVCLAAGQDIVWRCSDEARLRMRPLSDAFIESYLDANGADSYAGPGAYRLEGIGAQLFEATEGHFFTVLGLPLLPLLGELRHRGILAA